MRIAIRLKCKFYKADVRSVIMYGSESEYWAIDEKMKQYMSVAEIRMLRWMMSGVTRRQNKKLILNS